MKWYVFKRCSNMQCDVWRNAIRNWMSTHLTHLHKASKYGMHMMIDTQSYMISCIGIYYNLLIIIRIWVFIIKELFYCDSFVKKMMHHVPKILELNTLVVETIKSVVVFFCLFLNLFCTVIEHLLSMMSILYMYMYVSEM